MKTSVKLSALFVVLTAGLLTTTAAKATVGPDDGTPKGKTAAAPKARVAVTFNALDNDRGIKLNIVKSEDGRSFVKIYNKQNELLLQDFVPNKTDVSKGYVLTDLADGAYIMEITTNNQIVKKLIHVYQDGDQKSFYIEQE